MVKGTEESRLLPAQLGYGRFLEEGKVQQAWHRETEKKDLRCKKSCPECAIESTPKLNRHVGQVVTAYQLSDFACVP